MGLKIALDMSRIGSIRSSCEVSAGGLLVIGVEVALLDVDEDDEPPSMSCLAVNTA